MKLEAENQNELQNHEESSCAENYASWVKIGKPEKSRNISSVIYLTQNDHEIDISV